MSNAVTRHFVTIDGRWGPRQVHYRRTGTGPAVLLLHQSPQSSLDMLELMQRWALHFTLLAPDHPGYGQSDPLGPTTVPIEDFAAATLEFADATGLRRFGVYGYHTGASIGLWLAATHADRVTAIAANGLVQLTETERADILAKYLPPVMPSWDGSHLAWLWGRVREQTVFFPWYERSAAARMDFDMPSPQRLQSSLIEFLRAGDHYAIAYRAAFESRPETVLPELRVPLLVTAAPGDPLAAHLARYRDLPANVRVTPAASTADAPELGLQHLLAHRGDACMAPTATRPIPGRLWSSMVRGPHGHVHLRAELSGREEPLVLLHHAGQSSASIAGLAGGMLGRRPVAIADLPGHGESDAPGTMDAPSVSDCADAVAAVLGRLGLNEVALFGQGAGACVALTLAGRGLMPRPRLALTDLPCLDDEQRAAYRRHGMPSIAPQWHGGHLLLAWHLLRDGRLFFPWYERNRRGARPGTPDLDEHRLHQELGDLLKASGHWQALLSDALDYPTIEALRRPELATALGASPESPWRDATWAAAVAAGCQVVDLPVEPGRRIPALLGALQASRER